MPAPFTFTSRLTRKDHLWYFVRHYFLDLWTPWLVGFGLSAVLAVMNVLGGMPWLQVLLRFAILGLIIVVLMWGLAMLLYGARLRKSAEDGVLLSPKEVTVDAEGLHVAHPGGTGTHAWGGIEWIRERGRFVFLKLRGDPIVLLFARRDLPADGVATMRTLWGARGRERLQ